MELKVKLYLEENGEKFMGIGVLWLLQKIEEKKSLRAAAKDLEISYTKAYNMITNLEKCLNQQILIRQKGGQSRSGAVLTDFAIDFMKKYDTFQAQCKDLLKEPFERFKLDIYAHNIKI